MNKPLVSIIIVTYNQADYLATCLDSVLQNSYANFEVIVVDSNSADGSQEILQKWQKKTPQKFKLVLAKNNLGYAAGNNLAVQQAKGKYLFLLNADTQVTKHFLKPLVSKAETNLEIAACQPAVYLLKQPHKLNLTGKVAHYLGFDWLRDYQAAKLPQAGPIVSISGCGVLLRKTAFKQAHGLAANYFLYYEDSDLSWRLRLLGFKLWFVPESKIYHDYKFKPVTTNLAFQTKLFFCERNRLLTILKNYQLKTLWLLLPMIIIGEIAMMVYASLSGWGVAKLKTWPAVITQLNTLLRQRRKIQALRQVNDQQIMQKFHSRLGFIYADHLVVKYLLNPVLSAYYQLIKILV
ncbi:MAG: glycosyltransferase [Candidatus Pacebacteria bacterium]|nr:glycosyltransferase [Candidatus Paceibacterota bacterium]